jgi:nucleotide-binding universal stress UspA family protein
MFQQILVPLDGSKLAEAALPTAAWLSEKLGATVTLIHIIEQDAPQEVHGDRHLTSDEEACSYLSSIEESHFPSGNATSHVHTEKVQDVARSIAEHSGELQPDLIVMCTHGESGWRDIVAGSIAQQVIGHSNAPILLIHPMEGEQDQASFSKAMVALDASPEHEAALPVAAELARKLEISLHLLTVVDTLGSLPGERAASGWMLPRTTRAMLDMVEETAAERLEALAVTWRATGLSVTTEVRRGDPAQQILLGAKSAGVGVIVLATHGKAGMDAFWSGSVGPKVVSSTHLPVLLIPVKK